MTTNPPVTVIYTLEDLFTRFERNINEKIDKQSAEVKKQFAEVDQKIERQSAEFEQQLTEVNQKIERQSTEFKQQFAEVKQEFAEVNQKLVKLEIGQATLAGDIKALDATVAGINKRIDNAEFFNRSVAVTLVAAVFGGLAKWLGWLPTN